MAVSLEQFVERLDASGLLSKADVKALVEALPAKRPNRVGFRGDPVPYPTSLSGNGIETSAAPP